MAAHLPAENSSVYHHLRCCKPPVMSRAAISHVPNPRDEAEVNDLVIEHRSLLGLGLKSSSGYFDR
jgi:hypothetical protein